MPPKKRGRKPKNEKVNDVSEKKIPKKRGRKPKGGKIIKNIDQNLKKTIAKKPNIILQLKCTTEDLNLQEKKSEYSDKITSYSLNKSKQNNINYKQYNNILLEPHSQKSTMNKVDNSDNCCKQCSDDSNPDIKTIWEKLRVLKLKLHLNEVSDKRSHCFHCTCSFDNPPIYIPKQERNEIIEVYGCFCSPECAVAHLKNEHIDTSTRWERYALLNNIYGKIYNYEKNIKPAPNPFYTLDKYYGNLTIQEYRKLLSKDRLLLVVDKPLTKILPELYEENNELPNIFGDILSQSKTKDNHYRLKRNKPVNTKSSSINSNFGLN